MIRLSDVVGASGLSIYAVIALVLFMVAFGFALIALFHPRSRRNDLRMATLPLDDDREAAAAPRPATQLETNR